MASKAHAATRHIISINDLSNREIENIFEVAQSFLDELPDPQFAYKIGRSTNVASKSILASLFYEPSTRTRLSFESAMLRLGGQTITSADPATSSAAKGESLADAVRVISNYADIIVIRHPRDGAARLAAEYSPIPVINGGDGSHEHPTQTLCDLFTLKKKNKSLKNLKVAIAGDLKGSRTIHSFVYALARFGANIVPMAANGMELPAHVDRRLREEFRCDLVAGERRLDRRLVPDSRRAASAGAVRRARLRIPAQGPQGQDRRSLCHAFSERTLGGKGAVLSQDRREIPARREVFPRQRAASASARRRAGRRRWIPTRAPSISSRPPTGCRCAWR